MCSRMKPPLGKEGYTKDDPFGDNFNFQDLFDGGKQGFFIHESAISEELKNPLTLVNSQTVSLSPRIETRLNDD